MKRIHEKALTIIVIMGIVTSMIGCRKTNLASTDVDRLTLIIIGFYPASYVVFDVDAQRLVNRYDFTDSWVAGDFDYFSATATSLAKQRRDSWQMSEEKWATIIAALNDNDFLSLPSELKGADVTDYVSLYLYIAGPDLKHTSGGYAVDLSKRRDCKRFTRIFVTVEEVLKK